MKLLLAVFALIVCSSFSFQINGIGNILSSSFSKRTVLTLKANNVEVYDDESDDLPDVENEEPELEPEDFDIPIPGVVRYCPPPDEDEDVSMKKLNRMIQRSGRKYFTRVKMFHETKRERIVRKRDKFIRADIYRRSGIEYRRTSPEWEL